MLLPYDLSEPGGVKHHALGLARAMRELGDHVTIVGPAPRGYRSDGEVGFRGVATVTGNGSDNRLGLLVAPWKVWAFFRRRPFDVIHLHEPLAPSLPLWALWSTLGTPHVATFHAHDEHQSPTVVFSARAFARLHFPFIDRAMAVSTAAERSARAAWTRPLAVVPNGVSTRMFRPAAPPDARGGGGPLRLLFVGRINDERKGFRYLVASYRKLRSAGARIALDVVGEVGDAAPAPEPGMTYHGVLPLQDLIRRYRACDLFVAPSTGQESFGIVLLEAMACGKPIVCSDIDGYRTTVRRPGAVLVPPRDSAALADAIWRLLPDFGAREAMGALNRARALELDWDHIAVRVRREYQLAIEQRRERARAARMPAQLPRAEASIQRDGATLDELARPQAETRASSA